MNAAELRRIALEAGFADAALCDASAFDCQRQQVNTQPFLSERRQLRFAPWQDDARIRSLAVLLWPYVQQTAVSGRTLFIDSYYSASNAAYHAAKRIEEQLLALGCYAKANVSYPAKAAAVRAGLGVIGHNGLLIHPEHGTRIVIILLATDIEFTPAEKSLGTCAKCMRCFYACPAHAIDENGMSHPERCLRNYMMEGVVVPQEVRALMGNRLLGCDLCQRVCPMQKTTEENASGFHLEEFLTEDEGLFSENVRRLAQLVGKNTARPQRVRAQAAIAAGNIGNQEDLLVLKKWALSEFPAVREHALWAIERIEERYMRANISDTLGLDQIP